MRVESLPVEDVEPLKPRALVTRFIDRPSIEQQQASFDIADLPDPTWEQSDPTNSSS